MQVLPFPRACQKVGRCAVARVVIRRRLACAQAVCQNEILLTYERGSYDEERIAGKGSGLGRARSSAGPRTGQGSGLSQGSAYRFVDLFQKAYIRVRVEVLEIELDRDLVED